MRNVACWGLGGHARRNLLPALVSCTSTNLRGAWTRNQEVLSEVSGEHGIRSYGSEIEMLEDPSVDTVVLATPTGLHVDQGSLVISSGKHLWSEKSLFAAGEQGASLLERASSSNLDACEGFMFLYHPQFASLSNLLASGRLGRLFSISCRFGIPHLDQSNIRYDSDLGGGALLDAGCYPIAAAHALLGPSPERMMARVESEEGYSVDTYGTAVLEYESGVTAFLEWGFGLSYRNEIRAWCEEGSITVERAFSKPPNLATSIDIRDSRGGTESIRIDPADHFERMFQSLCSETRCDWVRDQSRLLAAILED